MKFVRLLPALLLLFLISACTTTQQATNSDGAISAGQLDQINDIITQMPAADSQEQQWLNAQLVEMAPASFHAVIRKLAAPGSGDDTPARYAVNGLTKYVTRGDGETDRAGYEQAIIKELQMDYPASVKSFLMEQLELAGSDAAVSILGSFVGDDLLNESAAHALRAINTSMATNTLVQGISKTQGIQQVALIKALGDMEATSPALVEVLKPYAASNDSQLRDVALYALANSGQSAASQAIENNGTIQHQLTFARRLAEEGYSEQATSIANEIYEGDNAVRHNIEAMSILAELNGDTAADVIVQAAQSGDQELRAAALELALQMQSNELISRIASLLDTSSAPVQADILEMMGQNGDSSSWSTIRPFISGNNAEVRIAAIGAAPSTGGSSAAYPLINALNRTSQQQEIEAIKIALLQLPAEAIYRVASQQWTGMPSHAKVALIQITAERQNSAYLDELLQQLSSSSSDVRIAILEGLPDMADSGDLRRVIRLLNEVRNHREQTLIQQAIAEIINSSDDENAAAPIAEAMQNAAGEQAISLLQVLPQIGGKQALQAVVEANNSADSSVQQAARQALSRWPGGSAITPLREAIATASEAELPDLISGYIRLVRNSMYTDADKVHFLTQVMDETNSEQQHAELIAALSEIESPASLRAISQYYPHSNTQIREQAMRAAAQILAPSYHFSDDFDGADQTLAVVEATTDSTTRQQIESYIGEIQTRQESAEGFTSLFNEEDLSGWTGATDAYTVQNGQLVHRAGASGNLFTEQEYSDFILRFQFKLTPGANNGLGIRSPLEGDAAYQGMELQILDNTAEKYSDLEPYQYHGSVYGIAPAQRGHLNPVGEWNTQEVIANGSQITVKLNGVTILDTDIEEASTPNTMDGREHPGLSRSSGHIGFLGHGDEVAFRNIQIRDLNVYYPDYSMGGNGGGGMNHPPEGFQALFNGENLDGWKGLVANPEERAKMSEQELANAQEEADRVMEQHWSARDGILFFDGHGESLTTAKDYKDFEMMVDWKIEPGGDSGVYLRGSPQVQIWDITEWPQGSGGLYNNQKNLSEPLIAADNPVGEWNRMRIKMVGERVTVHLNGQLVVPNVVLENYWNRDKPIYSSGQIELQAHNTPLYFKNVFIREIPRTEPLFNGQDLSDWQRVGGNAGSWNASDGLLYTEGDGEAWEKGAGGGWLSTTEMYDNFKLELEYRLPEGGNSGVFLRAPHSGDPAFEGLEIQLLDDYSDQYSGLEPWQYTGSIYDVKAPSKRVSKQAGQWQKMVIVADGPQIKVTLNQEMIINTNLIHHLKKVTEHPGLKRRKGYIGLQNHNSRVEFRNIEITEIK